MVIRLTMFLGARTIEGQQRSDHCIEGPAIATSVAETLLEM
jgi:hypothetical protein